MIQQRLTPMSIQRVRPDYPQVNYVDERDVQCIELNRGCPRQCVFCHADPNYKAFPIPRIESNKVQIIGEAFLHDQDIFDKIMQCGRIVVNDRVVYYGLSQGIDYRDLTVKLAVTLSRNRFGLINNKGNWYKGLRIAWDWGKEQERGVKKTIDLLEDVGYVRKQISVFVLVNWLIPYDVCVYKLSKLKEWGVKIDDCPWECTKRLYIPQYWDYNIYRKFRHECREHNIGWSKKSSGVSP